MEGEGRGGCWKDFLSLPHPLSLPFPGAFVPIVLLSAFPHLKFLTKGKRTSNKSPHFKRATLLH